MTRAPDDLTSASFPEFQDWRGDYAVFGSVVGQFTLNMNVTGRHEPARIRVATVSLDSFPVFGIQPLVGWTFAAEEHQPGSRHVVVIGYQLWQREFGGDTGAPANRSL